MRLLPWPSGCCPRLLQMRCRAKLLCFSTSHSLLVSGCQTVFFSPPFSIPYMYTARCTAKPLMTLQFTVAKCLDFSVCHKGGSDNNPAARINVSEVHFCKPRSFTFLYIATLCFFRLIFLLCVVSMLCL